MAAAGGDDPGNPVVAELVERLSGDLDAILSTHHKLLQKQINDWLARSDVVLEHIARSAACKEDASLCASSGLAKSAWVPPSDQCAACNEDTSPRGSSALMAKSTWVPPSDQCAASNEDSSPSGSSALIANTTVRLPALMPPSDQCFALKDITSPCASSGVMALTPLSPHGTLDQGDRPPQRLSTYSDAMRFARRQATIASYMKNSRQWRTVQVPLGEPLYVRFRKRVIDWLYQPSSSYFLTAVIVVYIITMAVEVGDVDAVVMIALVYVQHACNAIFMLELAARVFAEGRRFFVGGDWLLNGLDAVLVGISLMELATQAADATSSDSTLGNVMMLKAVRIVRVIRVIRVMRILRFFRPLRVLVHSICATMRSLIYAILLLSTIMFCFGIVFTQVARDAPSEPMARHFGSLFQSVLTLFESITNGISWHNAYKPLNDAHLVYGVLFVLYVVFAQLAVLNVMTGQFCQTAIESSKHCDEEVISEQLANKHFYVSKFREIFSRLSNDGDSIALDTFEENLSDERLLAFLSSLGIKVADAWTLFKLLEKGEDHCIDLEQFVEGCLRLHGDATAIGMHSLEHEIRWFMQHLDRQISKLNGASPRGSCLPAASEGDADGDARDAEVSV